MEKSGIFNAMKVGDTWDRVYKAENFAEYFATFIGNGVFPNPSTGLQVIAIDNNIQIRIKQGKGWINGYYYCNTDDLILKIDVADGVLNRIDKVVLRFDTVKRAINAYIKKGQYASNPVAPGLQRDADAYELALADIKVNAGAISISQSDITDLRLNKNLCGIVHGVVDQVDTTAIFNQFQSWYSQTKDFYNKDVATWTKEKKVDFEEWTDDKKKAFDNWYTQNTIAFLQEFNTWYGDNTTKWENDFNSWFSTIKGVLDGDIAGKLQNQINFLNNKLADINNKNIITAPTPPDGIVENRLWLDTSDDGYQKTELERIKEQLADNMTYSTYKLNADSNGIFTEVDYKRKDGTLILKSVLSGGISPNYVTRTETCYATDGTTVTATKVYTLSYNASGDAISEVLQ